MKESARARVVAIIGAASKDKSVSSVYDFTNRGYKNISVSINNGQVTGYDYTTSSHFSGNSGTGNLDFYDYETSKHVQLKMNDNNFEGFDYHSRKHFSGTINGTSVSLYDYETCLYYNFSF